MRSRETQGFQESNKLHLERRKRFSARSIFGDAIQECEDILRLRQQTILIDAAYLENIAPIEHDSVKRLVARAIGDVASVSRRGGALLLGAAQQAIVIQSSHPLDIPGDRLAIDEDLRKAARHLKIEVNLIWDQGRGPKLTLALPVAAAPSGHPNPVSA